MWLERKPGTFQGSVAYDKNFGLFLQGGGNWFYRRKDYLRQEWKAQYEFFCG